MGTFFKLYFWVVIFLLADSLVNIHVIILLLSSPQTWLPHLMLSPSAVLVAPHLVMIKLVLDDNQTDRINIDKSI